MVYGFLLMPLRRQRRQYSEKVRNTSPETMAADLCALVYRQGKTAGRFEMPIAELLNGSRWTREDLVLAFGTAARNDWIHRSQSCVTLKAAGIYVAKGVLGLPR
jgi:hypothetical protein